MARHGGIIRAMSHWLRMSVLLIASLTIFGCNGEDNTATNTTAPATTAPAPEPAVIGLELYPQKAPKTVERIVNFIEDGFYEKQRFHRVESWVVQWGSPLSRNTNLNDPSVGSGGSGMQILPFETNDIVMQPGTLAMASTGAKVGGDSQLFILTSALGQDQAQFLQGSYAAFGKVTSNMEAVDRIQVGDYVSMKVVDKTPELVKVELTVTPYQ
jgi:cyclophilin family peptidyl-prolyl cis-trans isomerase